ncbi:carbohydrate ABC transporter permease [Paenibacillus sp. CF384]|uniref:carbohydrate ABC transporter permease n=1 Tax=Paenibacillus sp. CF384 TaxID=1884382 RepID=UPI000897839F|nr:carbohydrate ABC transporter permease [Paenibacillus sp. CF384]SDW71532.1 multiple sugar transport system permease protein/putative aldouronate transport system permease protein [Paenibacillus sp. CF384]
MVRSKSVSEKVGTAIVYFILTVMTFACLFPILHTIAVSFSDKAAAVAGMVTVWPVRFTTASYDAIMQDKQFFRSFANSIFRVVLGGGINLILTVIMAYPLSKGIRYFPQRNIYMWFLILVMLFNGGIIPNYLLINEMNMLDTIWALVLPGAVPVFSVIILMNFFKALPEELEEAGRMDGANPWVIMVEIFVPLAAPSIATVTLFSIVGHWNAFFDGIIYMNTASKLPLQSYMQTLIVEIRETSMMSMEELQRISEVSSKTFNAAKVFVSMIPILLIYPFLQKYFVTGLVMGSVKG